MKKISLAFSFLFTLGVSFPIAAEADKDKPMASTIGSGEAASGAQDWAFSADGQGEGAAAGEGEVDSIYIPPTRLKHLPVNSEIVIKSDIIVPPYESRVVVSDQEMDIDHCGRIELNDVKTKLTLKESDKERLIEAGTVFKVKEVTQGIVTDKALDIPYFSHYTVKLKHNVVRHVTLKISSEKWKTFNRWERVEKCGVLSEFAADDLNMLSGGYMEISDLPDPKAIAGSR